MNTDESRKTGAMPSALSILFYWAFILCLSSLLAVSDGGTWGTGGNGGTGGGTGRGAAEEGTGEGAADTEQHGSQVGKGEGKTPAANADDGKGEMQEDEGVEDGEIEEKAAPSEEPAAEPSAADSGTEEAQAQQVSKRVQTWNIIGVEDTLPEKKTELTKDFMTSQRKGKTVLTGSEAGRREGFFGSGNISGRVLFILDVSGSMGDSTPENILRIDLLKRELKKVLQERLDALEHPGNHKDAKRTARGKFMLATFSESTSFYPPKKLLSFSDEKALRDALGYVDGLCLGGGTNMMQAFMDSSPLLSKHAFDWIYLLSDGEPTDCNEEELLDLLKRTKIKINTFSLGQKSSLLEKIASQHRGGYWEIY